jgi:hypothetical protein
MKVEIKVFHSPDVDDLEKYVPEEPDNFGFLLELSAGPKGEEGVESFDVMVCTPQWLISNKSKEDIIIGRHYLIVFEYDYERLMAYLKKYADAIDEKDWNGVAEKMSRIGRWEFEDYKEYKG